MTLDANGAPRDIVEKPDVAESRWAVTGLYFFDGRAPDIAAGLNPSARGEFEITDLNRTYLEFGELSVTRLGRGFTWPDTGTHDSLVAASEFVRTCQRRSKGTSLAGVNMHHLV